MVVKIEDGVNLPALVKCSGKSRGCFCLAASFRPAFLGEVLAELCAECPDPPSCSGEELSDSLLLDLRSRLDNEELVNVYLQCLGVYEVLLLRSWAPSPWTWSESLGSVTQVASAAQRFWCLEAGWGLWIATICISKGQKRFANHPFCCHVSAAEKIHGEKAQGKSPLFLIYIKRWVP